MSVYRFGPFVLDAQERRLLGDGKPIALTPKGFDTLVYLVERPGRLVGKDELLTAIWGDAVVEEGSLPRMIHVLRKALHGPGDSGSDRQFIETVPTKGYRFVAEVTPVERLPLPLPAGPAPSPPTTAVAGRTVRSRLFRVACLAAILVALGGFSWRFGLTAPGWARLTPQTQSGAAYARFQAGRLHLDRHLPGDVETALDHFEGAIQLDPAFAAAYAGKADAKFFRYWETGAHDDIAQARLAIRKAIALDDANSYAHALSCRLLGTYDWDFRAAEAECRRAVGLDPANHEARRELAFLLSATGRRDDAVTEMDAAIAIAPTSFNKRSRGLVLYFGRRFDEAIAQLRQVETTDPEYRESSRWIARSLEQQGKYDDALEYLLRYRESAGGNAEERVRFQRSLESGGWARVLRASLPQGQPAANLETAGTLAQLGDADAAFQVLESMVRARRVMIIHVNTDPRLDSLKSDSRFEPLLRRVGLQPATE